jgi:Reverse transcriptase (RNA-dependent DNA polymerase)
MAVPPGFTTDNGNSDQVIKLHKSIYGDKRSPCLWYFHLRAALAKLHFKPSPKDPCLFVGNNVTLVVHVDDCLIVARLKLKTIKLSRIYVWKVYISTRRMTLQDTLALPWIGKPMVLSTCDKPVSFVE